MSGCGSPDGPACGSIATCAGGCGSPDGSTGAVVDVDDEEWGGEAWVGGVGSVGGCGGEWSTCASGHDVSLLAFFSLAFSAALALRIWYAFFFGIVLW